MGSNKSGRRYTKTVAVMLQEDEWRQLREKLANTTCWSMSEYARKVLLGRPVTVFYRDQVLDSLLQEFILFRDLLASISAADPRLMPIIQQIKSSLNNIYDHVRQNKTQQKDK